MPDGLTLGDLQGKLERLEVVCRRCDRWGRYRVARLIDEHGADMELPDLRRHLAADCPNAKALALPDRCDLAFPQLARGAPDQDPQP